MARRQRELTIPWHVGTRVQSFVSFFLALLRKLETWARGETAGEPGRRPLRNALSVPKDPSRQTGKQRPAISNNRIYSPAHHRNTRIIKDDFRVSIAMDTLVSDLSVGLYCSQRPRRAGETLRTLICQRGRIVNIIHATLKHTTHIT